MELDSDPNPLGTKTLQELSLTELEVEINQGAVADASRSELLGILMGWLNEQIKQDSITQNEGLLDGFVKLLKMQNHAEVEPFNLTQVDEMFNEWLKKDAIQNPAYMRRYLITQQDVHHLFAEEKRSIQDSRSSSSLFEYQHGRAECYPPALSEDDNVRTEIEKTNLPQDVDYKTLLRTTQCSTFSSQTNIIEIDKPCQSVNLTNTNAALSEQLNNTDSQDTNADDVIITRESIVIPSSPIAKMPRRSKSNNRRGRAYKVHSDVSESTAPPKNYICRRCHEPGHWIQHCPTNLDPNYDQAPPRDYRCNFCGHHGDHFATLCPKNPYEGSLSKQRKQTIVETRGSRTPTRDSRRYYQVEESSTTRSRGRHRSRSPEQRSRGPYRSRSPEQRRPHQGRTNIYSPRTQNEDERRQPRRTDDSDISPYTTRSRLTRELYMNSDANDRRESSPRLRDNPFNFERRPNTVPSSYRSRSPLVKKPRKRRRDLDKVTSKTEEGRLAYDDEIDTQIRSISSLSVTDHPLQSTSAYSVGEDKLPRPTLASVVIAAEDLDNVENKTDEFLRALAAEFKLESEDISRPMAVNNHEAEREADGSRTMDICIDDTNYSGAAMDLEWPEAQAYSSPKSQLVLCPPFSPKVVFLFRARENHIINARAKRQTASQMMEKSEEVSTRRTEQADKVTAVHLPLPHRLLNTEVEDGAGASETSSSSSRNKLDLYADR
ncbi:hypothetical protein F4825DRAFT_447775 [Nemania diffusa]|nr:hypothetical protein F4825DRAFT_447775 [Nemania diffusa]